MTTKKEIGSHEVQKKNSLFAFGLAVCGVYTAESYSDPVNLTLAIEGLSEPLMVNAVQTDLPLGLIFTIVVDDATVDTWASSDFGNFAVEGVLVTIPDLAIDNIPVTTSLTYFEDSSPRQRAGLSLPFPDTGISISLTSSGESEIGNPNAVDSIPAIVGNPNVSIWGTEFGIVLEDGTDISSGSNFIFKCSLLDHTVRFSSVDLSCSFVNDPPQYLFQKSRAYYQKLSKAPNYWPSIEQQ